MSKDILKVGEIAPDFSLKDQNGGDFKLSSFLGKKNIVLFFYPKDGTSVCTKEACAFRDAYDVFIKSGAEIVGVSSDGFKAHKKFIADHSLPFILLSDEKNEVRKLYGAQTVFGLVPARVTYVIDKEGVIKMAFSAIMESKKHTDEALRVIETLG